MEWSTKPLVTSSSSPTFSARSASASSRRSAGPRDVRRQGRPRLEERAAPLPPARGARGRDRDGSALRKREQRVLGGARQALRLAAQLEDADLASVAAALGLDAKKADDAVKNHVWKKQIDDDNNLSQTLQASGTPHFFINGRRLVGAQPFDKFKEIIDSEITKAQGLLSSGTSQKDLYAALMKNAKAAGAAPAAAAGDLEKKPMPSITGAPWKGAKNAKVTVVEFSDFQCPFCKRVEPTVAQMMKEYGDKD